MGGLAGMGDLVLTCTGDLSRNRTVGLRIGRGEKLADITASMNAVAEGVLTSRRAQVMVRVRVGAGVWGQDAGLRVGVEEAAKEPVSQKQLRELLHPVCFSQYCVDAKST